MFTRTRRIAATVTFGLLAVTGLLAAPAGVLAAWIAATVLVGPLAVLAVHGANPTATRSETAAATKSVRCGSGRP